MLWSAPLPAWYAASGRHHLRWRATRDPWAVLVSEVMLQQTSVGRVAPRWEAFLRLWPDAASCAAAPLEAVLREWAGLGYPRRARALWETARVVAARGWPETEAGLLMLPGVGPYTARALCVLARDLDSAPPRDVNLGRVAARAGLGIEAHEASPPRRLDEVLATSRPAAMSARDYTLALFDIGATVCRARSPRCGGCPLREGCASATRLANASPSLPPRRQGPYQGSMRQLRGAVLAATLERGGALAPAGLRARLADLPAAQAEGAVEAALTSLRRDGLIPGAAADIPPPFRGAHAGRRPVASRHAHTLGLAGCRP